MDLLEVLNEVKGLITTQSDLSKKSIEEIKKNGAVPSEMTEKLQKMGEETARLTTVYNDAKAEQDKDKAKISELEAKIKDIERNGLRKAEGEDDARTIGQIFVDSTEYKEAVAARAGVSRKVEVKSFWLRKVDNLVSTPVTGTTGTLTEPTRLSGITQVPNVPLTIRALLPTGRTNSNMIEFVKENVFTNNAGPQYSPVGPSPSNAVTEGALKPKSNITWTLVQRPVSTIGHYMKASRQILDDAPMLQAEINNRLLYGLALEEEEQLLSGDGNNGNQLGIIPQSTPYNTGLNVANDTKIDKIRHGLLQVTLSRYLPTAIVMSPKDWHDIELTKVDGTPNTGAYVLSNPALQTDPKLWGYRVVASMSMTNGRFLVGNFATGAQIFDRMNATVEIARQNEDDFVRNMVSILAEERLALAVYNGACFVEGPF